MRIVAHFKHSCAYNKGTFAGRGRRMKKKEKKKKLNYGIG